MLAHKSEKYALLGNDFQISYSNLHQNVSLFVTVLGEVNPETRIVILSENRPEWVYSLYAIWSCDCIAVPLDYMASEDDLEYMLGDNLPGIIFCSEETKEKLENVLQKIENKPAVHVFEGIQKNHWKGKDFSPEIKNEEKTALILYTSGTTGNPKGVMLSFKNLIFNIKSVTEKAPVIKPDDHVFMLLPVHHIFPLMATLVLPLYLGCTVIVSPSLVAEDFTETTQRFKPTILVGVPRLYESIERRILRTLKKNSGTRLVFVISKLFKNKKFSQIVFKKVHQQFGGSVKYLITGGASLDSGTYTNFNALGFEVLEGYGLTETAPLIAFNRPGKSKPGSAGQAVPGVQLRIQDDEVLVKGDNVMQGYYNMPEETEKVIKDDWFYTGDLGFTDKEDFLFLTGRKSEIIVLPNGKNVNPKQIEKKIIDYDEGIKEAGVFLHDNILQALVYPDFKTLKGKSKNEIHEHLKWNVFEKLNDSLSRHKKIKKFHVAKSELPKTRMGKIKRFELPDFMEKRDEDHPQEKEPDLEEYKLIKEFITNETGQPVQPGDHPEMDLGIDSLTKVSLVSYISSTFGLEIEEQNLTDFKSISELAEYIHRKKTKTSEEKPDWSDILKKSTGITLPSSWPTYDGFVFVSKLFFALFYKVKTTGLDNLPESPYILAPSHKSFLDGFLLISRLGKKERRKIYSYATAEYFPGKLLHFMATKNNIIIMDIRKNLKLSMQKLAVALKRDKNLMIFPEGERTKSGELKEFKQTFAILSRELDVPVVPVAINGTFEALPRGKKIPRLFKTLEVKFLDPVYPEEKKYEDIRHEAYLKIKNELKI
ncbi:MAG: AMP-binding protein [Prolixibacteraceae bacterium]